MRSFTTRQTARIFSFAILTVALGMVQAQAKTDFTGTWKINSAKSDFGPIPPPDSVTVKIAHAEPSMKTNVASTGGPQGDMTYDATYTTDGKECVNRIGENELKSTVKWDGDDLAIESKGNFGGADFTAKGRWNLSGDGKVLTITQHYTSAMGEADVKEVFEKQ